MAYTKLFNSILHSTIWQEPPPTKIVWITMLAMCNKYGEVAASIPGLARAAGVSLEDCETALACLLAPDPYSRTKEYEGRRIEEVEGGWALLNHAKYRRMMSEEERREYNTLKQRERRERLKRERQEPNVSKNVNTCQELSMTVNDNQQCQHIQIHSTDTEADKSKDNNPPTQSKRGCVRLTAPAFDESDSDQFRFVLTEWFTHKREIGDAYRPTGWQKLLSQCRGKPIDQLRRDVDHSIASGYKGIFPAKEERNKPSARDKEIPTDVTHLKLKLL